MRVTITHQEYEAISFAIDQLHSVIEGATFEDFITDASSQLRSLYNVMEKYKKEKCKALEFQEVRASVAEHNRGHNLRSRDIDAMARKLLKKIKQEEKHG